MSHPIFFKRSIIVYNNQRSIFNDHLIKDKQVRLHGFRKIGGVGIISSGERPETGSNLLQCFIARKDDQLQALSAQQLLANASGFALKAKPIPII